MKFRICLTREKQETINEEAWIEVEADNKDEAEDDAWLQLNDAVEGRLIYNEPWPKEIEWNEIPPESKPKWSYCQSWAEAVSKT
mgnify:CR=1 FL=1